MVQGRSHPAATELIDNAVVRDDLADHWTKIVLA
jgi:hypothetical protein